MQLPVNSLEDAISVLNFALENQQEQNKNMSIRYSCHYIVRKIFSFITIVLHEIYYLHHKNDELGIDRESRFVFANAYHKGDHMDKTSLEVECPLQQVLECMHQNFKEYGK